VRKLSAIILPPERWFKIEITAIKFSFPIDRTSSPACIYGFALKGDPPALVNRNREPLSLMSVEKEREEACHREHSRGESRKKEWIYRESRRPPK
jgi:hypothetical protein